MRDIARHFEALRDIARHCDISAERALACKRAAWIALYSMHCIERRVFHCIRVYSSAYIELHVFLHTGESPELRCLLLSANRCLVAVQSAAATWRNKSLNCTSSENVHNETGRLARQATLAGVRSRPVSREVRARAAAGARKLTLLTEKDWVRDCMWQHWQVAIWADERLWCEEGEPRERGTGRRAAAPGEDGVGKARDGRRVCIGDASRPPSSRSPSCRCKSLLVLLQPTTTLLAQPLTSFLAAARPCDRPYYTHTQQVCGAVIRG